MDERKMITIRGARTHNLRNVDLDIPKGKYVVFTGVSGSGKSSLLFSTVYTEAQRQLVETFSAFARKRLPKLSRPPVDEIGNIATPIVIDQKRMGRTLRSTVGTATEIHTYLRLVFSRVGTPSIGPSFFFSFNNPEGMCPTCRGLGRKISIDTDMLLDPGKSLKEGGVVHPEFKVGGYYWQQAMRSGLFDPNKALGDFTRNELDTLLRAEPMEVERTLEGERYVVRFEGIVSKLERLYVNKGEDEVPDGRKDAYQKYLKYGDCPDCGSTRLNDRARGVVWEGKSLPELCAMELSDLDRWLEHVAPGAGDAAIAKVRRILGHLIRIGVGYLSLDRPVAGLSGGESQRVKMARQLDCDLVDMMYVLDEPSIGLHPRDTERLIEMLRGLRDKGNTVLVVEHDADVIRAADHAVDMGPGAGVHGGAVLYSGSIEGLAASDGPTGRSLSDQGPRRYTRRSPKSWFEIRGASENNLKNVDVDIPAGVLTCITGVAGSGKSSLIHGEFAKRWPEAVVVDQSPVGKNSRSTPLSYLGAFDYVRKAFAAATGSPPALFSFNSKGACPKCKGRGVLAVEMNFMDDIAITCDACSGLRYTEEVLGLRRNGKNVAEVLNLTAEEAIDFFDSNDIRKRLGMMVDVGLGYLELGQPLSELSGGEAQRLKLAGELHKKSGVYVMDEPSTGLHPADIDVFMKVVDRLVAAGNTVVIIEHNPEIMVRADWIVDLGPEGGKGGGVVIAEGTPEAVAAVEGSHTGQYLAKLLA